MAFWFVTVVTKYLNFVTFSENKKEWQRVTTDRARVKTSHCWLPLVWNGTKQQVIVRSLYSVTDMLIQFSRCVPKEEVVCNCQDQQQHSTLLTWKPTRITSTRILNTDSTKLACYDEGRSWLPLLQDRTNKDGAKMQHTNVLGNK